MFQINGITWWVVFVAANHPMLRRPNGTYAIGACDNATKTIYVKTNLPQPLLRKVLCHEITHAAMFSYSILLEPDQEETFADLIATYGDEIFYLTNEIFYIIMGLD